MPATQVAHLLLEWYSRNARNLPWRKRVTPYKTWVSEVMLQQTRVEAATPYFRRWMLRYPSLTALARAPERSVLALWEGLGYYSRARNLHRAARIVVREMRGRIPSDPAIFRALPGVGEYIAAAVASIAFGRDVAALDANVGRVLARLACLRLPLNNATGKERLRLIALRHLPKGRAGDFNQGLMDLGALICSPRKPRCDVCPLRAVCEARRLGLETRIPVRVKQRRRPHFYCSAAVIQRGERVALVQRAHGGLLGGLWEFPKSPQGLRLPTDRQMFRGFEACLPEGSRMAVVPKRALTAIDHTYSHFSITVRAFLCTATSGSHAAEIRWVPIHRLGQYPMGKVDRTIAGDLARSLREAGAGRAAMQYFDLSMSDHFSAGSHLDDRTSNSAARPAGFSSAGCLLRRAKTSLCAGNLQKRVLR